MNDQETEARERRVRPWAYGLLVCALMSFTFELGRQRGYVDARNETYETEDRYAAQEERIAHDLSFARDRYARSSAW